MYIHLHAFVDGYSSTVQGLLDWFEVDLGFTELLFIQIDLCVKCVFVLYSPVSLSSCPFFGHPALPPPRGGSASRVSSQSCQSHESLWGLWYSLAVLGVTITCSIGYDRADDPSRNIWAVHMYVYIWAHAHIHTHSLSFFHARTRKHTHTKTHKYTHTYIHTNTHTHNSAHKEGHFEIPIAVFV